MQDEQQDQSSREGQPTGPGLRAAQEGRDDPPERPAGREGPRGYLTHPVGWSPLAAAAVLRGTARVERESGGSSPQP